MRCPSMRPLIGVVLLASCQQTPVVRQYAEGSPWVGFQPLTAMAEGPTYHLLQGYDPIWLQHVRAGIEQARSYWGTYGPTHVWVAGREAGSQVSAAAKHAFLKEYCAWRTQTSTRTVDECWPHAERQFFDVIERDEPEAYLSGIRDTDPHKAELIFINVHKWYFARDAIPDPVLRGIHEYTHVFQQSVGAIPTWMSEGGAVFAEAWLPSLEGQRSPEIVMRRVMQHARQIAAPDLSIADMEEIETAPSEGAKYHRELAYDAGSWAIAFMIHSSPTKSVATLRDVFYPLVRKIGWESALCEYVGMESKAAFYAAFDAFMDQPIPEQLSLLRALRP